MTTASDVAAAFCAVLVDEWVRSGITDAVVAPGSRSTPLVTALAASPLRTHVVLDERSGGFCALGLGMVTGRPAPVVTTSGTAAAELHPAVVEADQGGVPMVVVTADRPPELHHVGAPQTVEQDDLFGASTRLTLRPGVADDAAAATWRSLASRVAAVALGASGAGPGPVHLNLAFREPLLGDPGVLVPGRADGGPWHRVTGSSADGAPAEVAELIAGHRGRRGVLVAGAGAGDPAVMAALAKELGWPILADPRSGLRTPGPNTVATADALLRVPEIGDLAPDIVVRLGAPWASKVVNQWFDGLGPSGPLSGGQGLGVRRILVDPRYRWADPGRGADLVVGVEPTALARAVLDVLHRDAPGDPAWAQRWRAWEEQAQRAIDGVLADPAGPGLSEPGLARRLMAEMTEGGILLTSSSMPVRDVEWWTRPRRGVRVIANRGANGIDGVLSTAIGVAVGSGAPTVALVGDLAYLYDAGALLWAGDRPLDLTVVVADNDGGGIFSFLPQASALDSATFERYWGTPHGAGVDLVALAGAYGVPARRLGSLDDLAPALGEGPGARVVVVHTDRQANVELHRRLHQGVAHAVGGRPAGG